MAKIALDLERALERRARDGTAGCTTTRWLAGGEDWKVGDVVCTSGPGDRPYEERHATLKDFCVELTELWANVRSPGHPVEVGHDCADHGAGLRMA